MLLPPGLHFWVNQNKDIKAMSDARDAGGTGTLSRLVIETIEMDLSKAISTFTSPS